MYYEIELKKAIENGTYHWEKTQDGSCYLLKDVVYCTAPFEDAVYYIGAGPGPGMIPPGAKPDGLLQSMYIYVPAEIFEGGSLNGWGAKTAPIIFQNNCSGWRSSNPSRPPMKSVLELGCVFVSCGARSRGAGKQRGTGRDLGKSPCAAVDLKAGVRFLRYNDAVIPGDKNKIISVGTSGGGQMSSILGASGNMPAYYPYLYEIGAAGIEKKGEEYISTVPDHVYGAQCYCPITDIANADAAYAWMRYDTGETGARVGGIHIPMRGGPGGPGGPGARPMVPFTPFQLALQHDLALAYCEYINSLGIKNERGELLSFDIGDDGRPDPRSGSFYRQMLENISDALNIYLKDTVQADGSFHVVRRGVGPNPGPDVVTVYDSPQAYLDSLENTEAWLVRNEDGSCRVTDLAGFLNGTRLKRNKNIPGFDTFHNTMESDAFGSEYVDKSHFSKLTADVLRANYDRYRLMDGFEKADVDDYISQANEPEVIEQTRLMASMLTLLNEKSDPAKHWRTRNGSADEHTSFSIAYTLAMAAKMNPKVESVNYGLPWGLPHCSAEGTASTGSFESWIEEICR